MIPRYADKRFELLEAGLACVANLKTDKELVQWARERNIDCYIGRHNKHYGQLPSKWHNPIHTGNRDFDCDSFARYLTEHPVGIDLTRHVWELKGRLLLCWCFPERCHGEILAEMANNTGGRP